MNINKIVKILVFVSLPILVQSSSYFSQIPRKYKLKYDHTFEVFSLLECAALCNCDVFHFENSTCYTANYPSKADNNEIYGRYFVKNSRINEAKGMCTTYASMSYVFEADGSCVWIPAVGSRSWILAKGHCEGNGGSLITAQTGVGLVKFIKTLNLTSDIGSIWVGGSDIADEGSWKWVDGAGISSSDPGWYDKEPNNANGIEHCCRANYFYQYKLNDEPCHYKSRFACSISLYNL